MMRITKVLILVLGMLLMFVTSVNASPMVDVIQSPTGFFVPSDPQVYDSPYYRWWDEDWSWAHNPIGVSITTASLYISAWDVDASNGEVDNIYAYDNGVRTLLGSLAGLNNDWGYSNFNLGSNFFDDIASGLQVDMDIDSTHNYDYWAVTLAKSALSIDGGTPPPPPPGVPEPATLLLLGSGLMGIGFAARKRFKK